MLVFTMYICQIYIYIYTSAHLTSDKLPFNLSDVNASFLEVNIICRIWRTQEEV